jgi:hypothetical protein
MRGRVVAGAIVTVVQPTVDGMLLQYSSTVWPLLHAKQLAVMALHHVLGTEGQPSVSGFPLQYSSML